MALRDPVALPRGVRHPPRSLRRSLFGLWDGSRLPTSTEPVAIASHAEPRQAQIDAQLRRLGVRRRSAPGIKLDGQV